MNKPIGPFKISDAERAKRLAAVNFARGSVRLEGFILSLECESLHARYVNGEITSEDRINELNKLYKKEVPTQLALETIPTYGLAEYVAELARQHGVFCIRTPNDELAEVVTRLADDDVITDGTEDVRM